jgi:AcrR family transcriptional regulator
VPQAVDTVNMVRERGDARQEERGYHHGNLREALVDAGVELARRGGPGAVLLRAVTREAGVSHNAAYRHFANQEDLLAAVAERCMGQLGQLMIDRSSQVRVRGAVRRAEERLGAIGRAYIDFARSEPGWFRTAFSSARAHGAGLPGSQPSGSVADDKGGRSAGPDDEQTKSPFLILGAHLDQLVAVGGLSPQRRRGAQFAAWSSVHGLSSLLLDGPLRDLPEPQVEYAIGAVLDAVGRGLR